MRKDTLSLLVILIALSIQSFGQTPQWKVVREFHLGPTDHPCRLGAFRWGVSIPESIL